MCICVCGHDVDAHWHKEPDLICPEGRDYKCPEPECACKYPDCIKCNLIKR